MRCAQDGRTLPVGRRKATERRGELFATSAQRIGTALLGGGLALLMTVMTSAPAPAASGLTAPVQVSTGTAQDNSLDVAANTSGKTAAVWVEGEPGEDPRVLLSTRAPGKVGWSSPTLVATVPDTKPKPLVVVGPSGEVLVNYMTVGGVTSRALSSGGTWSAPQQLSGSVLANAHGLVMAPDGTASALTRGFSAMPPGPIRVTSRPAGGVWGQPVTVTNAPDPARISVGPAGEVAVSWLTASSNNDAYVSIRPAGSSTFGPSEKIGPTYLDATTPQILFAANGITRAVFTRDIGSGMRAVRSVRNNTNGTWSTPLSESVLDSYDPVAVIDPNGVLYAVWVEQVSPGNQYLRTLRYVEGNSVATVLPSSTEQELMPGLDLALNTDNVPQIAWGRSPGINGNGTSYFYSARSDGTSAGTWGEPRTRAAGWLTAPIWTPAGNGQLSVTTLHDRSPGSGELVVASQVLDVRGPVATLTSPADRTRFSTTTVPLKWSMVDLSPTTASVLVSAAPWNSKFGSRTTWKSGLTGTSASFPAVPGRTYCFVVRGRDVHGSIGNVSNQRCAVTPVDDRTLSATTGWAKLTGSGFYRNTFRETSKLGQTLSLTGVAGKSYALLAATGPGQGSVAVYFGTTKIATLSLSGTTHKKRVVIPIRTFSSVKTGKITIKVISSNKRVRIDGLFVGR